MRPGPLARQQSGLVVAQRHVDLDQPLKHGAILLEVCGFGRKSISSVVPRGLHGSHGSLERLPRADEIISPHSETGPLDPRSSRRDKGGMGRLRPSFDRPARALALVALGVLLASCGSLLSPESFPDGDPAEGEGEVNVMRGALLVGASARAFNLVYRGEARPQAEAFARNLRRFAAETAAAAADAEAPEKTEETATDEGVEGQD